MFHPLPQLTYAYDALEPYIDGWTMELHHGKHHHSYVRKLNEALEGSPDLAGMSVEELMAAIDTVPPEIAVTVRHNGGGHANHTLFWTIMGPQQGGTPQGELAEKINSAFGSFERFQQEFTKAALGVFGSGWAWLTVGKDGLEIETTPNQDNPLMHGRKPILGVDVWEHAYYLKYQNRRADYLSAWWNVVNWDNVAKSYAGQPSWVDETAKV